MTALKWQPAESGPLHCNVPSPALQCPDTAEMDLLRAAGLRGVITPDGGGLRLRRGPMARVLIVASAPIPSEVRLKQPRHTTAAWIQIGSEWRVYPPDAPLLDREIIIAPREDGPEYAICSVRDVDGSLSGGACFTWHASNR